MNAAALPIVITTIATTLPLAGCDQAAPSQRAPIAPDERTLTPSKLTASLHSDTIRAAYRSAGLDIPELRVAYRRSDIEILAFPVSAEHAFGVWKQLRAVTDTTGHYPLILRSDYGVHQSSIEADSRSVQEILNQASTVNTDEWFASELAEVGSLDPGHVLPRDPGATVEPLTEPTLISDSEGEPHPYLFIALFPTTRGYEVPAFLSFGDFNAVPPAHVHVAVLKRWHDRWGAEPVAISDDTIEMHAIRPPKDLGDAIALATEHHLYAPESHNIQAGSIDAIASRITSNSLWFFWWD